MDVADNCDRCAHVDNIALSHEQLFGLCADGLDDRLSQELFLVQARDALVQIDGRCKSGRISIGPLSCVKAVRQGD